MHKKSRHMPVFNPNHPHQPRHSIAAYWCVCAAVGLASGFFKGLAHPNPTHAPPPRWLLAAAAVATLAPQPFYFAATARASAEKRKLSLIGITLFAIVNGILETAAFDAAARAGAALTTAAAVDAAHHPAARAVAAFTTLSAYCGFIHALFWEHVFPPHLPAPGTREARAMRLCLALFGPMTATWCGLLLAGDGGRRAVVVAHVVADAAAATALRLQAPAGWG